MPYFLDGSGVVWQVWNQLPIAFVNHDAITNYFANARPGTWWLSGEVGNILLRPLPPSAVFEAFDSSGSFAFYWLTAIAMPYVRVMFAALSPPLTAGPCIPLGQWNDVAVNSGNGMTRTRVEHVLYSPNPMSLGGQFGWPD